jgi:hypothetical protein
MSDRFHNQSARQYAGPATSGIFCVAPMTQRHYYLLARHSEDLRWHIEFGAGDLQDVMNKRDSYREHGQTGTELKIVSVPDDHLATIKALISELNGKL